MYKQVRKEDGSTNPDVILREADNAFIPNDLLNRDWQAYQEWLSLGNTPEEAE